MSTRGPDGRRHLDEEEEIEIQMVRKMICPECNGPLFPQHDLDGQTIVAVLCPNDGSFTTPRGRASVRQVRQARGANLDTGELE